MSNFTRRRAQQLINGGVPVAVGAVVRGADGAVVLQLGNARFVLERDDAIGLAMLVLKYAGVDMEVTGGEESSG